MQESLHVAIIPDANRRWAKKRGLKPWEGHEAGAQNLERILEAAKDCQIKHLSFWGSSGDNLKKRPLRERRELLRIYEKYFKKLINADKVHDNKIKINVFGGWRKQFPATLANIIEEAIERTKNYSNYYVNFFLAYSGDKEMEKAVINIARKFKEGKLKEITQKTIKNNLETKDLPPVDLLIRSGSVDDPHFSGGFMMWDTQDSQLFFSKKDWPDFDKKELQKAVTEYRNRKRRFGK